jgi:glutamate synthase domain-containing protein 2
MASSIHIDLHKISKFVNLSIPVLLVLFLGAGTFISFYFHFLTVAFLFMTIANFFYMNVQKEHVILKNFGLMGQARYIIESIGPEMRQYLFASDTEERPFNREERSEVYRKAKGIDSASSFGSQQNFDPTEIKIRHTMFPTPKEALQPFKVTYGEERGLDSAYTITRPIMISAMSYGALGTNAVRSLARGAKQANIPMNTGEGGYPEYHLMENCDLIFQIGTAKFGVRTDDGLLDDAKLAEIASKPQIRMIEIKFSQGAKPGKGGLLPKEKITDEIAKLRGIKKGQDVVSPPYHPECDTVENTVSFIKRVQEVSGLPTGFKLCLGKLSEFEVFVEEMKRQDVYPDFITVDGAEGGTGAAPKAFLDGVGLPLLLGLTSIQDCLKRHGIRDRMKLNASGKLISSRAQLVAFALGADAIYSARGFMLSLGCIQALQCGNNTCPTGITTHDPELQKGLVIESRAPRIANYVHNTEHDLEELLRATGCKSFSDLTEENLYIPSDTVLGNYGLSSPKIQLAS